MSIAFVDRIPTVQEVERIRLILSTYQDGTGMLRDNKNAGMTLPGWRDFERSVALALDGIPLESKYIFDVLLNDPEQRDTHYGISCKMRSELNRIARDGRVTIEVSNSSGKFWAHLHTKGVYQHNYLEKPDIVGSGLLELIEQWYLAESMELGGKTDLKKSSYLVLSWNEAGWYQMHQFPLMFPDPNSLKWSCPTKLVKGVERTSRRIIGNDGQGTLFEWYGESGGQLKYYPFERTALWKSDRFRLEPLGDIKHGILAKVATYFPDQWRLASQDSFD
jgi:hypothetical protein